MEKPEEFKNLTKLMEYIQPTSLKYIAKFYKSQKKCKNHTESNTMTPRKFKFLSYKV